MDKATRWAADENLTGPDAEVIDTLIAAMAEGNLERSMNRKIGTFVEACRLVERDNFMSDPNRPCCREILRMR